MPTHDEILKSLESVIDPELRQNIVVLGMVRSIQQRDGGEVDVTVSLTTPGCPIRSHFQTGVADGRPRAGRRHRRHRRVRRALRPGEGRPAAEARPRRRCPSGALAGVANVLCVGSGKGGVGKSTLTVNLAAALAAEGKKVGVLDADVWGYSVPRMVGLGGRRPPVNDERKILPLDAHGIKVMSIGFFVQEDSAVVWRGPMLHKALTQFLEDVAWGELDYLLVDLPPGTGDVSMTLSQLLPQAKFLITTTPQPAAQKVARRAAEMAGKVDLEIAGIVENMSGFTTPERRALPDLRRGRRPGAGRRARRAAARQGAADHAAARAGRRRRPARAHGPGRSGGPGDPSDGARHHRDDARRAAGAHHGRSGAGPVSWASRCPWRASTKLRVQPPEILDPEVGVEPARVRQRPRAGARRRSRAARPIVASRLRERGAERADAEDRDGRRLPLARPARRGRPRPARSSSSPRSAAARVGRSTRFVTPTP